MDTYGDWGQLWVPYDAEVLAVKPRDTDLIVGLFSQSYHGSMGTFQLRAEEPTMTVLSIIQIGSNTWAGTRILSIELDLGLWGLHYVGVGA